MNPRGRSIGSSSPPSDTSPSLIRSDQPAPGCLSTIVASVGNLGLVPLSYLAFGALVAVAGITASCVVAAVLSLVTCAWGLATPVLRDAQRVVARPASR